MLFKCQLDVKILAGCILCAAWSTHLITVVSQHCLAFYEDKRQNNRRLGSLLNHFMLLAPGEIN